MNRQPFSQAQQAQALHTGYVTSEHRHARGMNVTTYPIDNTPPERRSDRDDGINVSELPEKHHRAVMTIADVAGHIPADSSLGEVPTSRAFTVYRPWARDPMLPFELSEDRLSLEHREDRLGINVVVELDEHYRPIAFRLERKVVTPHCCDYAGAGELLKPEAEGQAADDMKRIAHVAVGLRKNFFSGSMDVAGRDEEVGSRPATAAEGENPQYMAVTKMVEVYMILANNMVAEFFDKAHLPFLFRNHHGGDERAYYSPENNGHAALQDEGLRGAYCHFTSPIRRGADFINAHMAHYVMDVMEGIEAGLKNLLKVSGAEFDDKKLTAAMWQHGTELMDDAHKLHTAPNRTQTIVPKRHMESVLTDILKEAAPDAQLHLTHGQAIGEIISAAGDVKPPYSFADLAKKVHSINALNDSESVALRSAEVKNAIKAADRLERIQLSQKNATAETYSQREAKAFSADIHNAAITGLLAPALIEQIDDRLAQDKLELAKDAFSILILCEEFAQPDWVRLKKAVLNAIEHRPDIINNVFEIGQREGVIHPHTYIAETVLMDNSATGTGKGSGGEHLVNAALVVTHDDSLKGQEFTAATFSLGYSQKEAERHARFNFLRTAAFGQLGPVDQAVLPNSLYAEMNTGRSALAVLKEIVDEIGGTINQFGPNPKNPAPGEKVSVALQVISPEINNGERPILKRSTRESVEEALEKAARDVLRDWRFKRASAGLEPMALNFPRNPEDVIHELAVQNDWQLTTRDREIGRGSKPEFEITVELEIPHGTDGTEKVVTSATARNKYTARLQAYDQMRDELTTRGLIEQQEPSMGQNFDWRSWAVQDARSNGTSTLPGK